MFRPNRMAANGAFLPLVFGVMSLVLVNGAFIDTLVLADKSGGMRLKMTPGCWP